MNTDDFPKADEAEQLADELARVSVQFIKQYVPKTLHEEAMLAMTGLLGIGLNCGGAGMLRALSKAGPPVVMADKLKKFESHKQN